MTQAELAVRAGVAQQTVSLIERGHGGEATVRLMQRIAAPLGATVDLTFRWRGPDINRLDDARHASIVNAVVARLGTGWDVITEYTFNVFGDRGSVDILAWHPATRTLLLIEIKSELDGLESLLRSMDTKMRVVPGLVARARGWRARCVGQILVLPEESAARRVVAQMGAVFAAALPSRTVAVREWLREPTGPIRGIWFLSITPAGRVIRNPGSPGRVCHVRRARVHAQKGAEMRANMRSEGLATAESASNTPPRRR